MRLLSCLVLTVCLLAGPCLAHAADLAGHWTAEFDSQIGPQKYTYDFTADGAKLTGKATYDHSMGKGESVLKDIKVTGDHVAFAEVARFDGNELIITYDGKLAADEMKLTRHVGDFATEEIVVRRGKAPETPPPPAAK